MWGRKAYAGVAHPMRSKRLVYKMVEAEAEAKVELEGLVRTNLPKPQTMMGWEADGLNGRLGGLRTAEKGKAERESNEQSTLMAPGSVATGKDKS